MSLHIPISLILLLWFLKFEIWEHIYLVWNTYLLVFLVRGIHMCWKKVTISSFYILVRPGLDMKNKIFLTPLHFEYPQNCPKVKKYKFFFKCTRLTAKLKSFLKMHSHFWSLALFRHNYFETFIPYKNIRNVPKKITIRIKTDVCIWGLYFWNTASVTVFLMSDAL